jgi:hypothetical protein
MSETCKQGSNETIGLSRNTFFCITWLFPLCIILWILSLFNIRIWLLFTKILGANKGSYISQIIGIWQMSYICVWFLTNHRITCLKQLKILNLETKVLFFAIVTILIRLIVCMLFTSAFVMPNISCSTFDLLNSLIFFLNFRPFLFV